MILFKWRKHKEKEEKAETCQRCKHLYYNSDGSACCNSIYEKACLQSGARVFKELT